MTKRLMLMEENQISFHSDDGLMFDGVKDYSHQIAEMIGLGSDMEFHQAGVRTVLDVGCGFGSFGAHLLSVKLMTVCMAAYELTGSQVQISLERGLPAIIGNFNSRQLPFPSLSYDMVHCAECGILWDDKDGLLLIEADRILKPGGYFVLHGSSLSTKKGSMASPIEEFVQKICWTFIAQQEKTFIWQKTIDTQCYSSSTQGAIPPCREEKEEFQPYYQPLASCWRNYQQTLGIQQDEYYEDFESSLSALRNCWSLLTPLIFSDHPKRLGDEDPLPPYNMIRNVMDMNSYYGGLNATFLEEGKAVWVMNVVPINARNTLLVILDQGFARVLHDWCEPFPTYPRTYDMLHANGLLSYLISQQCSITNLLLEMHRILRPEVNYVNCHATSTLAGDLAEVNAIKKVFMDTSGIKMNGTKSMIGHGLGAAGGLEAIACVKAINTGWLHPTINQDNLEPQVDIDTVPNVKTQHEVNVGMC